VNIRHIHVLAFVVLSLGVAFIFLTQDKRQDCDIFIENFQKATQSDLYSQTFKNSAFPPRVLGALEVCREGNNGGACLDLRQIVLKVLEAGDRVPHRCQEALSLSDPLKNTFIEFLKVYLEMAWGGEPPKSANHLGEGSWLDYSDYALFCRVKNRLLSLYGQDFNQKMESYLLKDLWGDSPIMQGSQCLNCDFRKKALQTMSLSEIKKRSLLGLNCSRF
jgi:hypothetical protein